MVFRLEWPVRHSSLFFTVIHENHHLVSNVLHLLAGGGLGLVAASLAHHFGARSADRLPGESRRPQCVFCLRPLTWQSICPLFGWLLRPDPFRLSCPCGQQTGLWPQPAAGDVRLCLRYACCVPRRLALVSGTARAWSRPASRHGNY